MYTSVDNNTGVQEAIDLFLVVKVIAFKFIVISFKKGLEPCRPIEEAPLVKPKADIADLKKDISVRVPVCLVLNVCGPGFIFVTFVIVVLGLDVASLFRVRNVRIIARIRLVAQDTP